MMQSLALSVLSQYEGSAPASGSRARPITSTTGGNIEEKACLPQTAEASPVREAGGGYEAGALTDIWAATRRLHK